MASNQGGYYTGAGGSYGTQPGQQGYGAPAYGYGGGMQPQQTGYGAGGGSFVGYQPTGMMSQSQQPAYGASGYPQAPQQGYGLQAQKTGGYQPQGAGYGAPLQAQKTGGYQQPGGYGAPLQAQKTGGYQQPGGYGAPLQAQKTGGYQQPGGYGAPLQAQKTGGYQQPGGYGAPLQAQKTGGYGGYPQAPSGYQASNYGQAMAQQPTGYGMQMQSSGYGLPQQYGVQPQATGFGMQPQPSAFGAQPQATGFGMPSQASGFAAQPQATGFGTSAPPLRAQKTGSNPHIPPVRLSFVSSGDQQKFEDLFKSAVGSEAAMDGETARQLLIRSGLPPQELSKIWKLVDTNRTGHLLFPEFVLAMYLCHERMKGEATPEVLPNNIATEVGSLVDRISFSIADSGTQKPSQLLKSQMTGSQFGPSYFTSLQPQKTGAYQFPMPTGQASQQAFGSGFQQPQPTGYQLGSQQPQQMPYQQSGYQPVPQTSYASPMQTGLQPQKTGGFQPKSQFGSQFTGMAAGTVSQQPLTSQPTGKPGQWGFVNTPSSGLPGMENMSQQLMPNQAVPSSSFSMPSLSSQPYIPWAISKDEKRIYDGIFDAWDKSKEGYLSGKVGIEIFSQSGLSRSDLELIWALSDPGNKGKLDRDEFAVALHLLYRKLNGYDIPARLPPELVPPSARNFSDSVSGLKTLIQSESTGRSASPGMTSYMKSHSFRNQPALDRKDATLYHHNDDVPGYVSSSRHGASSSSRLSSATPVEEAKSSQEEVARLKKLVHEKKIVLSSIDTRDAENADRNNDMDERDMQLAHDLQRRIREVQREINQLPNAYILEVDDGADRRLLHRDLQRLADRLPDIASKVRKAERQISEKKLELFRITDAKSHPESASSIVGTGPNGEVTESDKRRAKATAMMHARMAALTGKPAPKEDDNGEAAAQRFETEKAKVYDEQKKNDELVRGVEESIASMQDDIESSLRGLQEGQNDYGEHERRRWIDGFGVEPEVRDFIYELQKMKPASVPKDAVTRSAETAPKPIERVMTSTPSTNTSEMSASDRKAYYKAEAQRRMNERLAALGIKPAGSKQDDSAERERLENERRARAEEEERKRMELRKQRLAAERGELDPTPSPAAAPPSVPPPAQTEPQPSSVPTSVAAPPAPIEQPQPVSALPKPVLDTPTESPAPASADKEGTSSDEFVSASAESSDIEFSPGPAPESQQSSKWPDIQSRPPQPASQPLGQQQSQPPASNNPFFNLNKGQTQSPAGPVQISPAPAPAVPPVAQAPPAPSPAPVRAAVPSAPRPASPDEDWDREESDSEDEDDDIKRPAGKNPADLARMLFGSMGPMRPQKTGETAMSSTPSVAPTPPPPPPPTTRAPASAGAPPAPPPPVPGMAPPPPPVPGMAPPPPPGGMPPPPPPPSAGAPPAPSATPGRSALLSSIQTGTTLRKVQTNDRSAPKV